MQTKNYVQCVTQKNTWMYYLNTCWHMEWTKHVKDLCCTYCSTNIFTEYVSDNIIALQKIKLILLVEPRICVDID